MKPEYSQAVTYAIGKPKKQVKEPSENLFNQMLKCYLANLWWKENIQNLRGTQWTF